MAFFTRSLWRSCFQIYHILLFSRAKAVKIVIPHACKLLFWSFLLPFLSFQAKILCFEPIWRSFKVKMTFRLKVKVYIRSKFHLSNAVSLYILTFFLKLATHTFSREELIGSNELYHVKVIWRSNIVLAGISQPMFFFNVKVGLTT